MAETNEKQPTQGAVLVAIGPHDTSIGSDILRFERENENKDTIDFTRGKEVKIGTGKDEVTKTEAEALMANTVWKFEIR